MRGLSLVAASWGHSSSRCAGLSLSRPLLLRSTGSRRAGSVVVAHGPSCSAACGIFPDQGSNPCPLHWQADSQPLCHQGSPPSWYYLLSSGVLHNWNSGAENLHPLIICPCLSVSTAPCLQKDHTLIFVLFAFPHSQNKTVFPLIFVYTFVSYCFPYVYIFFNYAFNDIFTSNFRKLH